MTDLLRSREEREALFTEVAARRGVAPVVVEKDFWVCWTLARLVSLPDAPKVTFKGGTTLSKVHGLIERFSEDLDLAFLREGWGLKDPEEPGISGNEQNRRVDAIMDRAREVLHQQVLPALRSAIAGALGTEDGWTLIPDEHDRDELTLVFTYPPGVEGGGSYIRQAVRLEFGARAEPWPVADERIVPYVEEEIPGVAPDAIAIVRTLAPERTFWEKATAVHVLVNDAEAKPEKRRDRMSRHLYDLHQMWQRSDLRARLVESAPLYDAVVHHKRLYFKSGTAKYDDALARKLRLLPHEALEATLRSDYAAMREMIYGEVPSFDALLESLKEVAAVVASWAPQESA